MDCFIKHENLSIAKQLKGFDGARDRNRTDTAFTDNRILSPARLPVPPPGLTSTGRNKKRQH